MIKSKTVFTSTEWGSGLETEVLEWLQQNGTEYFDTITLSGNYIKCCIGETDVIEIITSTGKIAMPQLGNNASMSGFVFTHGYVLENGLLLINQSTEINSKGKFVYFGKSSAGNTCLIAMDRPSQSTVGYSVGLWAADLVASSTFSYWYAANSTYNLSDAIKFVNQASMNVLTPIVMPNEIYCPDAFILTYTEYRGIIGRFSIDGEEYFSNGYCAFK